MQVVQKIRLFLSSPGDVEAERQRVPAIVAQINRILGNRLCFHLDHIEWKTHVAPDMGRPQEVINRQIGDYDLFVGIMWKRFGTPTGEAESGTEEEFKIAYANWQKFSRPRILFYFNHAPSSPASQKEIRQWGKVIAFKEKLGKKGLICEYNSTDEFAALLFEHLGNVMNEWFPAKEEASVQEKKPPRPDFSRYLKYLKAETMYIDIRGLTTGEPKAHQFQIDQLYIPLKTTAAGLALDKGRMKAGQAIEGLRPGEISLQEALQEPKLVIKGDPGAGKTTFLRLIAFCLCRRWLQEEEAPSGTMKIFWPEPAPLPIFIRLGLLAGYIQGNGKQNGTAPSPAQEDSPGWLCQFLEEQSREYNWGLSADDFCHELKKGRALILLDGLDEAPDRVIRERISSLAVNLLRAFPKCQMVLTSRPAALIGPAMPADFAMAEILPLDESAMKTFLTQWSAVLYPDPDARERSRRHLEELSHALQSRPEIRLMARTPVMLTALAVVHWNENQLPEQRVELYESIIIWLIRSREKRTGRLKADRCRKLLQKLALAMFIHPQGRQRQIGLREAAEAVADEMSPADGNTQVEQAEYFLRDEMVDSGIIVERGHRLEFWHLSFQEYLVAYEIAGLSEEKQKTLLFVDERLYSSEWRESLLLLAGVLYKQGEGKINHFIDEIISHGPKQVTHNTLATLAKKVGLLGCLVKDLSPFGFKPANPEYPHIARSVMGIFDKDTYRNIPVQVRIEAADALAQVGDPRLVSDFRSPGNLNGVLMVSIQGGIFWMGVQKRDSKKPNFDHAAAVYVPESPSHQVELSPFSISKYPITVSQYQRFIEDGGYEKKKYWEAGGFDQFKDTDKWQDQLSYLSRPVVGVSWYEASAFACWMGGRLPTEAEWERAARGPDQKYRKYPWGNEEPWAETANFFESRIGKATPVGIFPENCSAEGAIDMAGNVWEWCLDWYSDEYYQICARQGVVKDSCGPEKGNLRVIRGGAYYLDSDFLRCAYRGRFIPDSRDDYVGFRVVQAAQS